ncbi:ABC transporter ATP-binding protein [Marinomonas agarivorans]|nr:ABC transporter ATP-binding protein [Marinomonas agarivorans]
MLFFNPGRLVEKDMKDDAFRTLTQSQQSFYRSHPVGGLISIVNNDINGIRAMAGVGMMNIFNIFFTLSMTPLKMWQISPSLMLFCLLPVLMSFTIVNYAIRALRTLLNKRMQYLQALSTTTVNFLNGVDVIQANQVQDWVLRKFGKHNQDVLTISLAQLRIRTFIMPLLEYTEAALKILILGVGGWYLLQSDLTLGQLTAFLAYASLLAMPFMSLGRLISTLQMGMVSLKSMGRILRNREAIQDETSKIQADKKRPLMNFSKGIEVRNLHFRYPDTTAKHYVDQEGTNNNSFDEDHAGFALKNISFQIKPGEKVAILGRVGSGKSTLVNCLNRFYDINENSIFIDGVDITTLSRRTLRAMVRTVTQEPFLFSDTLKHNVQFGSAAYEQVDDEKQLSQVLAQSAMAKEVSLFPDGVNTLVGEKGILLSGGQKQRISLARGIYTPTKLMILDNVLSAVDNETERFLLKQIFEALPSQSCLIVSHRQAVLEQVDTILLIENGEIIAQGNHKTLLAESSLYRETWQFLQTDTDDNPESSIKTEIGDNVHQGGGDV